MNPEEPTEPEIKLPIFTIGYGNRNIDEFYSILKKQSIVYLIDIRTSPYSRYNQSFSREFLTDWLKLRGIHYVFMGDNLGGRPMDDDCYSDGKVAYEKVQEKDFYKEGIVRLMSAWNKNLSTVLMCSEIKPEECHRSKLIGNTLLQNKVEVQHIDENDNLVCQLDIIKRITGGQTELFGLPPEVQRSRKKYNPPPKEFE